MKTISILLSLALLLALTGTPSAAPKQRHVAPAQVAPLKEEFFLSVTYVTGKDQPDITQSFKEDSLDDCLIDAREFITHPVPDAVRDRVIGVVAACGKKLGPESKT